MGNSKDNAFRPFHNFVSQDVRVTLHVVDILLRCGAPSCLSFAMTRFPFVGVLVMTPKAQTVHISSDLTCGLRRSAPYVVAFIPASYLLHLFLLHFPFAGVLILKEGMTPKA